MAKSKSGGTRSFLRGRVGSDVYSIGRNAKGKRQQVVRSLAEQVSNPQTAAQMKGRAIMSTVMQAVSAMAGIVDHSFSGIKAGQPCISEFIAQNYKLIKADVEANPVSGNKFGIVLYQEKGAKQGAYIISDGNGQPLQNVTFDSAAKTLTIAVGDDLTPASLRAALGIGVNDFFTLCALKADGKFLYERARVFAEMAADEAITGANVDDVFTMEGNNPFTASVSGTNIVLTYEDASDNYGIIVSRKEADGYKYNRVQLAQVASPNYPFSVAIVTYPEGSKRFLNGGSEGDVTNGEDTPLPFDGQLTALTYAGTSVLAQSASAYKGSSAAIAGTVSALPSSGTLALYIGDDNIGTISATTFSLTNTNNVAGVITLRRNGNVIQTCGTITNSEPIPGGGQ